MTSFFGVRHVYREKHGRMYTGETTIPKSLTEIFRCVMYTGRRGSLIYTGENIRPLSTASFLSDASRIQEETSSWTLNAANIAFQKAFNSDIDA